MIVACISLNGWWMRELDVSQAKHGCESSLEFLCVCVCPEMLQNDLMTIPAIWVKVQRFCNGIWKLFLSRKCAHVCLFGN